VCDKLIYVMNQTIQHACLTPYCMELDRRTDASEQ